MSNKFKSWRSDHKRFDPGEKRMHPNRHGKNKKPSRITNDCLILVDQPEDRRYWKTYYED
jgi:hypothetical protein